MEENIAHPRDANLLHGCGLEFLPFWESTIVQNRSGAVEQVLVASTDERARMPPAPKKNSNVGCAVWCSLLLVFVLGWTIYQRGYLEPLRMKEAGETGKREGAAWADTVPLDPANFAVAQNATNNSRPRDFFASGRYRDAYLSAFRSAAEQRYTDRLKADNLYVAISAPNFPELLETAVLRKRYFQDTTHYGPKWDPAKVKPESVVITSPRISMHNKRGIPLKLKARRGDSFPLMATREKFYEIRVYSSEPRLIPKAAAARRVVKVGLPSDESTRRKLVEALARRERAADSIARRVNQLTPEQKALVLDQMVVQVGHSTRVSNVFLVPHKLFTEGRQKGWLHDWTAKDPMVR